MQFRTAKHERRTSIFKFLGCLRSRTAFLHITALHGLPLHFSFNHFSVINTIPIIAINYNGVSTKTLWILSLMFATTTRPYSTLKYTSSFCGRDFEKKYFSQTVRIDNMIETLLNIHFAAYELFIRRRRVERS